MPGGLLPGPRPAPQASSGCPLRERSARRGPPSHHLAWGGLLAACDGSPGEEGLPQTRASCQAAWGECRACRRNGRETWAGLPPPLLTGGTRKPQPRVDCHPPPPTPPGGNGVACCSPGRCSRPAPAGEAGTRQTVRKAGGQPGSAPCPMPALSPGVLLTAAGLGSRTP